MGPSWVFIHFVPRVARLGRAWTTAVVQWPFLYRAAGLET